MLGSPVFIPKPATPKNPDLGPSLLGLARDAISSGKLNKALDFALRAVRSFESAGGCSAADDLATSLRLLAAVYSGLGRVDQAVPVLERAIEVPGSAMLERFAGLMQLGDAYSAMARLELAISCYGSGLTAQIEALGESDPRVVETYRYLAEAHMQAIRFDEDEEFCKKTLKIHKDHTTPGSLGRKAKVDYETAPEGLVLAIDEATSEAHTGVTLYVVGRYSEALTAFESAVAKLRASGETKTAFFGILLNQMGLACVQLYKISQAAELFEEAAEILELECGPCHLHTLGAYSNLSATYDAVGRVEDAIEILEYIVKVREEKLGTANPEVDDEKKRLCQLLKEVGRSRNRKVTSLRNLLDFNSVGKKKKGTKKWSGFSFIF